MHLTWFGHAAFGVETRGKRVLFDPYSSQIGYAPIDEAFDFVCVSHDNARYHSCLDEVRATEVLDALQLAQNGETITRDGLEFGALQAFEDAEGNGPNAMAWLQTEDLRLLHMGDCGHALSLELVEKCGAVDVLLAPTGGPPTLELGDLLDFIAALRPRLIVPMHYAVPQLQTLSLLPLEPFQTAFIARFGAENVESADASRIELSPETLGRESQLRILSPAR